MVGGEDSWGNKDRKDRLAQVIKDQKSDWDGSQGRCRDCGLKIEAGTGLARAAQPVEPAQPVAAMPR